MDVVSEKAAMIRGEIGRPASAISGFCDECGEWSDVLMYSEGILPAKYVEARSHIKNRLVWTNTLITNIRCKKLG